MNVFQVVNVGPISVAPSGKNRAYRHSIQKSFHCRESATSGIEILYT